MSHGLNRHGKSLAFGQAAALGDGSHRTRQIPIAFSNASQAFDALKVAAGFTKFKKK
jgi:hypothetical protein